MCEVSLTHSGGRDYPESRPPACEGNIVKSLVDLKIVSGEEDKKPQDRLAKMLTTPVDEVPLVNPSVVHGVCSMVANDVKVQVVQPSSRVEDAGRRHMIDSRRCWENSRAEVTAEIA